MKRCRGYKLNAPYSIELVKLSLSTPPPEYLEISVHYCALCGSDIREYRGQSTVIYPKFIGHEFVGEVISVGEDVTRFVPGDFVTSDLTYRCGKCAYCRSGKSHMCVDEAKGLFTNRAFASCLHIHQDYLYAVGSLLPVYRAALTEPLACVLHALDLAKPTSVDSILVLGCGGIGALTVVALSAQGLGRNVCVFDKKQGKAEFVAATVGNGVHLATPNERFSLIIEATGSAPAAVEACSLLDNGGRILVISRYNRQSAMEIPHWIIAKKEGTLMFSHHNGEPMVVHRAIDHLRSRWKERFDAMFPVVSADMIPYYYDNYESLEQCKLIFDIKRSAI